MSVRSRRFWLRPRSARRAALAELRDEARCRLPDSYLRLLWDSGGKPVELRLPDSTWWLWPAEEVLRLNQFFDVGDNYPGLFGIGGDGAQGLLALDTRASAVQPVVALPLIGLWEELTVLAPDFDSLLARRSRP